MPTEPLHLAIGHSRGAFNLAVDAAIPAHGITALTGPSGAGKSTLLRLIAGLERPDNGTIRYGGETWSAPGRGGHLRPDQRPVGLMFQDSRLFPHLDVAGNLAFADRRRPRPVAGPERDQVIAALDLAPLLERRPVHLSGGEQRRVALARTLLTGPKLLLLDEPLTGLDRARKRMILAYIERVHRRFALPMLYVSHDMADIARLADTLWVMEAGRIVQAGPADAVLANWAGLETGSDGARLVATVTGHVTGSGLTQLEADGQAIDTPLDPSLEVGDTVRLWVRAQDVAIATARPAGISIRNILPVTIRSVTPEAGAPDATLTLAFGAQTLRARISRASINDLSLSPGQRVFALLKTVRLEAGGL